MAFRATWRLCPSLFIAPRSSEVSDLAKDGLGGRADGTSLENSQS